MEEKDIINLWKTQNDKVEQSLAINKQLLKEALYQKATSVIRSLKPIRWIGIIAGVLWCFGVGLVVISSWDFTTLFFKVSLIINFFVTAFAVALYFYHLVLMAEFDNSQNVVEAQKTLIRLKESNLKTLGILWIQLPIFSTWYINYDWIENSPLTFWLIQVPVVLIQACIGFWIYRNLHYKNYNKKWFRWFVSKGEFAQIQKAMSILGDAEELKAQK